MDRIQVVRKSPRISVNKLGEYMVASPRRRRRIIQDQKEPHEFVVARYRDAEEVIGEFLRSGADDDAAVQEAIQRLQFKPKKSDWDTTTAKLCAGALEAFLEVLDDLNLAGDAVVRDFSRHPLRLAGVAISVRPEIILRQKEPGAATKMGAIKLCFSKTKRLQEESASYIGAVLQEYMRSVYPDRQVVRERCQVVDVFGRRVFEAPRAHKTRLEDVSAACEEIARAWPDL